MKRIPSYEHWIAKVYRKSTSGRLLCMLSSRSYAQYSGNVAATRAIWTRHSCSKQDILVTIWQYWKITKVIRFIRRCRQEIYSRCDAIRITWILMIYNLTVQMETFSWQMLTLLHLKHAVTSQQVRNKWQKLLDNNNWKTGHKFGKKMYNVASFYRQMLFC